MARILIAEDDHVSQKVIQKMVSDLGHETFLSPNGRHAWESLRFNAQVFQMLITDVMMPEMSGLELIERIRADSPIQHLPIIIVSAYVGVKEISHFLEIGATVFQPKPVEKEILAQNINRALQVTNQP